MQKMASHQVVQIPVEHIIPDPNQPRSDFSQVPRLVNSFRKVGQLMPILITELDSSTYRIVDGESRHQAAEVLEWETIGCIIVDLEPESRRDIQFASNVIRSALNPFELAAEYQRILSDHCLKQAELAAELGESESTISSILKLGKLPEEIRTRLAGPCRDAGVEQLVLVSRAPSVDIMHEMTDSIIAGTTVAELRKKLKGLTKSIDSNKATKNEASLDLAIPKPQILPNPDECQAEEQPSIDQLIIQRWWATYSVHAVRNCDLLEILAADFGLNKFSLSTWIEEHLGTVVGGYRVLSVWLAPSKIVHQLIPAEFDRPEYQGELTSRRREHKETTAGVS